MKILYINSLPTFGGGEKHLLNLIRELKEEDTFTIAVACPQGSPLAKELSKLGVKVYPVPLKSKFDFKSILILRNLIRKEKFDIVHTEDVRSNLLGTIAAFIAKAPIIVWTVHMLSINRSIKEMNPIKRRIWTLVDRNLAKHIDKIITVSEFNRRELVEKEKIDPNKIVVIPSSIRLEEFNRQVDPDKKRKELGIKSYEKIVGYVGRLDYQKGLVYLLEAAKIIIQNLPNVRFVIIGDGPQRNELKEKAKSLGIIKNIIFAGFKSNVSEFYSLFDITVLPSLYEGLPVVPMESMAYEKPVIATKVGGVPEEVINEETGLLVPPGDFRSLADAIIRLLQNDDLRREMGKKGKKLVEKRYNNKQMVKAHKTLYEKLIRI